MTKLGTFIKLDFITIKPYLTAKSLLIYFGLAIFLTLTSGNATSGMVVGMMLGTLFVGYPFALGEKSNIDALYVTLSVNRKTVVTGRYLFILALDVIIIICSYITALLAQVIGRTLKFEQTTGDTQSIILIMAAAFLLLQIFQLPIYFKHPYSKAKLMSMLPLGAMAGAYGLILGGTNGGVFSMPSLDFIKDNLTITVGLVILVIFVLTYISYGLSMIFYSKREF